MRFDNYLLFLKLSTMNYFIRFSFKVICKTFNYSYHFHLFPANFCVNLVSMLYRELLANELDNQREDFVRFVETQNENLTKYLEILERLKTNSSQEISDKILQSENVGAIPSDELDVEKSFSCGFDESWANHEEARNWANKVLQNRTTFAADGSQLYAEKDTSLPIGAIQIGWFENPHDATQSYEKNAQFRILSPQILLEDQEEPMNPETRVGELRFHAEVEKVTEFLSKKKGWQERGEKMPLAFFDGTLLVSFSLPQTVLQKSFVDAMVNLVRHSQTVKVPLVGYVDRSFSRDLLNLLDAFENRLTSDKQTLYDATILGAETSNFEKILKSWGERTIFCYSRRKGLNAFIDNETDKSLVGFTYLQTTSSNLPTRIDVPAWIFEANLLDELVDVVRAECIIGLGYPYALETADQTALISLRDREIFLGALQEFAKTHKLNFSISRKNTSKGRRR